MAFTVKIDATPFVAARHDLESRQLPFVLAKTLTDVAKDAQAEVKRSVQKSFTLRNTWTTQGIRIKPADKKGIDGTIQADVHTDTANRATGAPDYLEKQEDGGDRVPFGGREHIAIPTKYLRKYAPRQIPTPLRPKYLLPANAKEGDSYKGSFTSGVKRYEKIGKRAAKSLGSSNFVAFLKRDHAGTLCIFVRPGTKKDAEPWYVLVTSAHIRKSGLTMEATVRRIANERFERQWEKNWQQAYAGGLKI